MKRALVTGASRGIGLELVHQCLKRGDRVFAGCRNPEQAADLQSLAGSFAAQLVVFSLDVTDEKTIDASKEIVAAQVQALDLLLNNAGANFGNETIISLKAETMVQTFRVNAVGPMLVAKRYLDLLKGGNSPRIINVSSEAGSISRMDRSRGYAYYGSKAALNMFTRALAFDENLGDVIVIALHPGWVRTDMGGSMAPLAPADSARGILKVADGLTKGDTGKFYTFEGAEYPW